MSVSSNNIASIFSEQLEAIKISIIDLLIKIAPLALGITFVLFAIMLILRFFRHICALSDFGHDVLPCEDTDGFIVDTVEFDGEIYYQGGDGNLYDDPYEAMEVSGFGSEDGNDFSFDDDGRPLDDIYYDDGFKA